MIKFFTSRSSMLLNCKYNYIAPSCYDIDTKPNPVISIILGSNNKKTYELHLRVKNSQLQLFENVVPRTAENFKRLLLGYGKYQQRNLSLIGTNVHQYIEQNFIQLGKMVDGNCSIFGPTFRDQSFELLHDRPGLLTSISEQNTNNSEFAITLAPCPYMDLKNIVFGEVTRETIPNLAEIEKIGHGLLDVRILSSKVIFEAQ